MKRVVSSSIISLLIIIAVAATFIYLRNFRNPGGDPLTAIPSDAAFVIEYHGSTGALNNFLRNEYWSTITQSPTFKKLKSDLVFMDSCFSNNSAVKAMLSVQPLYLSGHVTGANQFDFLFLLSISQNKNENEIDAFMNSVNADPDNTNERNYDGNTIREISVGSNKVFTYTISKGVFIGSFTSFLVEDAIRQIKLGKSTVPGYKELTEQLNPSEPKLIINFNNLQAFFNVFLDPSQAEKLNGVKKFCGWACMDLKSSTDYFAFNGKTSDEDSAKFVNCFRGQKPGSKKLFQILPSKTAVVEYYGMSDFKEYYTQLNRQLNVQDINGARKKLLSSVFNMYKLRIDEKMTEWVGDEYACLITEPAGVNYDNNVYGIFRAKKISEAKKSLTQITQLVDKKFNTKTMEESYNGHSIGLIRLTGVFEVLYGNLFSRLSRMYYTDIGQYIVFANQASALRTLIDEQKSGNLLVKEDLFKKQQIRLNPQANFVFYARPAAASYIFKSVATGEWKAYAEQYKDVLNGISGFQYQYIKNGESNQTQAVIEFDKGKQEEVNLLFAVQADSSVSMKPFLTTDPVTKTRQIVFQDDAENLYLTDNSGNIIWKKSIDGKIMSDIYEVDYFKNNSRQFMFNTAQYIYLIGSDGTPVGNFPIRLPAIATNGIAVFDFDNSKEPKIYVACENHRVYAYLASGKPLPGWNYIANTGTVTDVVRSFKFKGKDLLLIHDKEGMVSIVNRFGEAGIPVEKGFTIAQNSGIWFSDGVSGSEMMVTSDDAGNIVSVDGDGKVDIIPLNSAGADHGFLYEDVNGDGNRDFIFKDKNEITAYSKSMVLIYRKTFDGTLDGAISLVKLSDGKNGMAVHSDASNKTWLLNMQGEIVKGFPVKGNTQPVIDEINLDGNKNLVVGSGDFNVYIYSLN